ncbi:MAG TPA: isoprenyl transferase [Tenuifilaceae bacterium]|nr:isoprenyl transferase [Tenuifilaceae bacterium]
MSLIDKIDRNRLPAHVAIIMDGNGRWAQQKGKPRVFGHQNAVAAVRAATEAAAELGIQYLTLYAFSTENWHRPRVEIEALMKLLSATIDAEIDTLLKNNIQFQTIGDIGLLPAPLQAKINAAKQRTEHCTGLKLVVALSYSARWEIVTAAKEFAAQCAGGLKDPTSLTAEGFASYLNTSNMPDPELLIRTSGEYRISNFLLWQIAYTELHFTEVLWPDFSKEDFFKAIIDFQSRERRFGMTSEQL